MKFCPMCGIPLVPGAIFCHECGFKINQGKETHHDQARMIQEQQMRAAAQGYYPQHSQLPQPQPPNRNTPQRPPAQAAQPYPQHSQLPQPQPHILQGPQPKTVQKQKLYTPDGKRICPECEGKGAAYEYLENDCDYCQGTGKCHECNGGGECEYCKGDPQANCEVCKGARMCYRCHGTGKCRECSGMGKAKGREYKCGLCNGTGKI